MHTCTCASKIAMKSSVHPAYTSYACTYAFYTHAYMHMHIKNSHEKQCIPSMVTAQNWRERFAGESQSMVDVWREHES